MGGYAVILMVLVLAISTVVQWFFINIIIDRLNYLQQQINDLTDAHNWNIQELQHRSEQTQVVRVVEL